MTDVNKNNKTPIDKVMEEITTEENNIIDTSKFQPITTQQIIEILGLTIKRDAVNKLITFLAQLSVYTENCQINISFNAPSSSGKSFIPLEISYLFPKEDLIKLGGASPTAFFHEQGIYNKEKNTITVDLSKKIIIFLDQPNNQLLAKLRSLLSHDEKEIIIKITDKNQKGGNRTKTVIIKGFPVVIFCSAGLILDEQEVTRFLLLSPEISQEKIREAIQEKIKKDANNVAYDNTIEADPGRKLLKDRILAIRQANIKDIKINNPALVEKLFFERSTKLKPRNQRDIGKITNIIKLLALFNLWFRKNKDKIIYTADEDIKEAFSIWDEISESQELNLPPYVYNLYKDIIVSVYKEKNSENHSGVNVGLTRQDIAQKHFEVYGRFLPDWQLRQQILPMLETAGLITQEKNDPVDKRKILIYPTISLTIPNDENNSEPDGGVDQNNSTNEEKKPSDNDIELKTKEKEIRNKLSKFNKESTEYSQLNKEWFALREEGVRRGLWNFVPSPEE